MADDNQDLRAILDAAADTQGSNIFGLEDMPASSDTWDPFGQLALEDGSQAHAEVPRDDNIDELRAIADMSVADPLALVNMFDAEHHDRAGSLTISSTSEGSESRTARTRRDDSTAGGTNIGGERVTGTFHIISSSDGGAIAGNGGHDESTHRSLMMLPDPHIVSGTVHNPVDDVGLENREQNVSPISQFSSTGLRESEEDRGRDVVDEPGQKREYPFGDEDPATAIRGILDQSGVLTGDDIIAAASAGSQGHDFHGHTGNTGGTMASILFGEENRVRRPESVKRGIDEGVGREISRGRIISGDGGATMDHAARSDDASDASAKRVRGAEDFSPSVHMAGRVTPERGGGGISASSSGLNSPVPTGSGRLMEHNMFTPPTDNKCGSWHRAGSSPSKRMAGAGISPENEMRREILEMDGKVCQLEMIVIDAREGVGKNTEDLRRVDNMISSLNLTAHEAHNMAVDASRRSNEAEILITSRIEHELQAVREIAEGRPQDSGQEMHSVPGSAIGTMIHKNKEMIDTVRSSTASSFQYYDKRLKDVETHSNERISRVDDDVGKLHTKMRSMSAATESHTHALEGHRAALKLSRSDTGWRSLRVEEAEESIRKVSSRIERLERNMRTQQTPGESAGSREMKMNMCESFGCSCGKPGTSHGGCIDARARKAVQDSAGIIQGNKESMGKVAKELITLKTRAGVLENDVHGNKERLQKISDVAEKRHKKLADGVDDLNKRISAVVKESDTTSEKHELSIMGVKCDIGEACDRMSKLESANQEIISKQHGFADDVIELRRQISKNTKMITGLDDIKGAQIPRGRVQGGQGNADARSRSENAPTTSGEQSRDLESIELRYTQLERNTRKVKLQDQ